MPFPLKDVRFTTRRAGRDEPQIYPRLLRDRSVHPKIDIAVQYFETMLGGERRELDTEVLVHFFGDYKLARCMVGCLARGYRYRSPTIAEIVRAAALRRLRKRGIETPRDLRLHLFDRVNMDGDGFLRAADRPPTFERTEAELGLRRAELERLLFLDADEHAILTRVGAPPRPADVAAQYNVGVLETLLRHAERVELRFVGVPAAATRAMLALCRANNVDAALDHTGSNVRLEIRGRQDAMGTWARHGRRVARTVVQLLERGRGNAYGGEADVVLRDRRGRLSLTSEVLDVLGGAPARDAGWQDEAGWDPETLAAALAAHRGARDRSAAVRDIRRLPDPSAWAGGVVAPDLLVRTDQGGALVCAVRSAAHGARLASFAAPATTGEPLVFVGRPGTLEPLCAVAAHVVPTSTFDLALIAEAVPRLLEVPASQVA